MPKMVVFLDALDPRECVGWLAETKQGRVISGVPRVTPSVIGSFLTGKTPGQHGLVRPTPLYRPFIQRPKGDTIIDLVAKRGRVLSYLIPFTLGVNPPNSIVAQAGMAEESNIQHPVLIMPQVGFDPISVEPEQMLHSYVDHVRNVFSTMRQLIRNDRADVYFVSIREIDAFTHWHYGTDCRSRLIEYIAAEMEETVAMGRDLDLFWFSDHGGCPKTGRFEINRWLIDKGYLKVTYLQKRHQKQLEMMKMANPDFKIYKDQVGIHTPFVQVEDDSKFISVDLFDACVDVLDASDDEIEELRRELMDTGHFKAVYRKHELYGEDCDEDVPEIIPDRKDGVLVSANVHPNAEAPDAESIVNLRTGDHSPYGCYGGTYYFNSEDIHPWELYSIVDEITGDIENKKEEVSLSSSEEHDIVAMLERKGYV
ncbi:MAG: alkaline phosphatase family protein [Candidatus Thorarchaeota archaeon]